jgi:transposase
MAMGRRAKQRRQEPLWIAHTELPRTVAHPFYEQLNRLLEERGFDDFVEQQCRRFYADRMGRPSLTPGRYFRLLLIGYFEGIDGERGMAWRAADSLALRSFLGVGLNEMPPDHSTISRTRRLMDVETHQAVFRWVLELLAEKGLLKGKTVGIDATTLEANAAMRSIVRRDTGEGYEVFLRRLAEESGVETPTREQLAKLDRKRARKGSNEDWVNPHDPEAGITKLKDGRTHLAYKAEHAVDLETGAVVAVTVASGDAGDTETMLETLPQAGEHIAEVACAINNEAVGARVRPEGPLEAVTDKGYHSNDTLTALAEAEVRTYLSEPDRGQRRWQGKAEAQQAVYGNRRRIRGERGKALLRRRGEILERSFAHAYETGGMRRVYLRGCQNVLKRVLIHLGAFNLSLVMRQLRGKGTPRGWQGYSADNLLTLLQLWMAVLVRIAGEAASPPMPLAEKFHSPRGRVNNPLLPRTARTAIFGSIVRTVPTSGLRGCMTSTAMSGGCNCADLSCRIQAASS